ncbi:MAG: hypothetical protein VYC19_03930 [Pseudomonadota bacterium]|nr:hypothetical protein [Pseudomonadota bacterium]MEC7701879.1 hypothetical protein [Pseudomonadota bacterium]MEE3323213.1 hypothetical protein [Pseudomonadota bacterium]
MTNYVGLKLSDADQQKLRAKFQPQFSTLKCDHITLSLTDDFTQAQKLAQAIKDVKITGYVTDNKGIDILLVTINGTHQRDWWGYYHITHSLNPNINAPRDYDIFSAPNAQTAMPYSPKIANGLLHKAFTDAASLKQNNIDVVHLNTPITITPKPYMKHNGQHTPL